jgi:hypothetical protein
MQNLKQQGSLGGTRRFKCPKPLFIGKKTFMKVDMKGDAFFIYVLPSPNVDPRPHKIPSQYKEFKYAFEKRNTNTLPKHRPYDCTIDIVEGMQPPFKHIYNLSQDELAALHKYLNENLKKRFI